MKLSLALLVPLAGLLVTGADTKPTYRQETVIDPEVTALMEHDPYARHDLILTVRLSRAPISVRGLKASNEDRNECARLWEAWQDLKDQREHGGQVSEETVADALSAARSADNGVEDADRLARVAYHEDYSSLSQEALGPVYERLHAQFEDRVRIVSEDLNLLAFSALTTLCSGGTTPTTIASRPMTTRSIVTLSWEPASLFQ